MKKIYDNLYVGGDKDCRNFKGAIVHACQSCFVNSVHGNKGDTKVFEINNNLYLNLLDISSLSFEYAFPMIKRSMEFIDEHIKDMEVLVHCNFGMSRSPSIALLYMARKGYINNNSFKDALKDFVKIYSYYSPGLGMYRYFDTYWQEIMTF
ncbi:dual specificity protein phosphatase family protein [Brachyspira alvinipulli]|uniref:dual specificity protein phosphatase family protein n=1 Tax=Brachyspira alvinipulli TaxID=84379 RepID=UPI000486CFF9|nr:dual specificity protein phosphatase family protein [Brachyspira alvinipulli]